jgi:FkbM family methyltransferase
MLFDKNLFYNLLKLYNINIHGVLHIGSHLCEEMNVYNEMNIKSDNIIWLDANIDKINICKQRGIPNVYFCVASDADNQQVNFSITNNGESSSILELGTHKQHYPTITVVDNKEVLTTTIDTFMTNNNLDGKKYNLWNLDIQGAELKALKGGINNLQYVDAVYMEVNIEEVYKGCALLPEIDMFMGKNGFMRIHTVLVRQGWGDALYVRIK